MIKIQFCCGTNKIPGWENYDNDQDISKALKFSSNRADFIFIEHGIEHITQYEALNFSFELHRILKPNGILRIAFPDITKITNGAPEFDKFIKDFFKLKEIDNRTSAYRTMTEWGHKSFWNFEIMKSMLLTVGFNVENKDYEVRQSNVKELENLEAHDLGSIFSLGYAQHTSIIQTIKN